MVITAELSIVILITYLFWYAQSFGNVFIILYGSTLISVGCVFTHMLSKRDIYIQDYPIGVTMPFLLVIYCFFTSLFCAQNRTGTLNATVTFFAFTLVCFVISYISIEKQSIEWLINIIIVIIFLCCFWATFFGMELPGYGKALGYYNNPHVLGAIMNIGVFALAYKGGVNVVKSFFLMLLSIWPIYVIINCSSRKGLLAVCILFLFWGCFLVQHIFCYESNFVKAICVLFIVFVIAFIIFYYNNIYINTTMANRMSQFTEEESNTFRVYLYEIAIDIFKEHPFCGVGINGFRYVSVTKSMSHSTYAESIADFGFIGCIIYYIPIINSLITAIHRFFVCKYEYRTGLIIALIFTELFFGIGQVFFFQPIHFIIWTIIYCYLHLIKMQYPINNSTISSRQHLYLKKG